MENPKWEPYIKAREKFISVKAGILVVRGRCKEIKPQTEGKKFAKKEPESPEALAVDLRKAGNSLDEIKSAIAKKFTNAGKK